MDLHVTTDRGDVWLGRRGGPVTVRPSLILWVRSGIEDIALVRWPTTIGGWQPAEYDGVIVRRYYPSPVGQRWWRDLLVSPVWLPPESTPARELVERSGEGWELRETAFGPGYASAYGLVALLHHRAGDGDADLYDTAIRTHGSWNYRSILRGQSTLTARTLTAEAARTFPVFMQAVRPPSTQGTPP
jgi:hypothetical protein